MQKNKRNHKHVVRTSFKRIQQPTKRVKSKTGRKASSTKLGKGSFISRMTTQIRRIMGRK